MKTYTHLTTDERVALMLMQGQGLRLPSVNRHLVQHVSSLSREFKRNRTAHYYDVIQTCALARERRSKVRRLSRLLPGSELFQVRTEMLKSGWAPQQIAARLKLQWPDKPELHVSHESIYLAIYTHPLGELKRQFISYLRQGHGERRLRTVSSGRRGRYPADLSIHKRLPKLEDRLVPRHWKSDLIMGAGNRSAVSTMVERTSRFVVLAKLDRPKSECATQAITREMSRLAPSLLKTMTHDQSSEMARYSEITFQTDIKIYFARPHSPWQRISNENANGLMRQFLPKGTDLSDVSQERLDEITNLLNTRPRQALSWKFTMKVFVEYLQLSLSNSLQTIN